jgi:hypothetical protein
VDLKRAKRVPRSEVRMGLEVNKWFFFVHDFICELREKENRESFVRGINFRGHYDDLSAPPLPPPESKNRAFFNKE